MASKVEQLIEFHTAHGFGGREAMLDRNREARELYTALSPEEASLLAKAALAASENDPDCTEAVLCCLQIRNGR